MVVQNGRTYWSLASHSVNINGFSRWEQAFRVYSNIYSKANPHRAPELIEYNHVIHTISQTFVWENVYGYDKEFRLHMSKFPHRSWAMILQQAWSLKLKDKISYNGAPGGSGSSGHHQQHLTPTRRAKINEPCRRYNRGKYNFGTNCKFEHKCSYCFKYGHPSVSCRKAQDRRVDRDKNWTGRRTDTEKLHESHEFSDKNKSAA